MRLHRALRSDWSDIAPQQRTTVQRWAAGSRGVITPGNLVSLAGGVLVVWGLYEISHRQLVTGVTAILVGRLADILDGIVADATQTKSPLGEALDASLDKLLIVLALYVLLHDHLLPLPVGIGMAVHAVYSIGVSSVARAWNVDLHPSRAGKLGALFEWLSVGLYLLSDIFRQQQQSITLTRDIAAISFGLFVVTSVMSSLHYTQHVYFKQTMRS
jgi:phosphatidylglycerophosphate synthase